MTFPHLVSNFFYILAIFIQFVNDSRIIFKVFDSRNKTLEKHHGNVTKHSISQFFMTETSRENYFNIKVKEFLRSIAIIYRNILG